MFKSFAGLWLLIFVPLFLLLYPSSINPIINFNTHIEKQRYVEIYAVTFKLIEQRLDGYQGEALVNEFNNIRADFGFDIRLTNIDTLNLDQGDIDTLEEGQFVFVNNEPEYLLKRITDNGRIIQLYTDFSSDEDIYQSAKGTVSLIKHELSGLEANSLDRAVAALEKIFPYAINVVKFADLSLSNTDRQRLSGRGFFWRESSPSEVSFYIPVAQHDYFLVASLIPTTSVNTSNIFILIGGFILVISVCMFMWVYPVWRDLKRLVSATEQLGRGELSSRAFVSSISVVATLGKTFNVMAERLSQLLFGQRTLTNAIAHDLRTPLYRLKFAFEMLENATDENQRTRYRASVNSCINDLDHFASQTLLLSRYNNEKDFVTFEEYDVSSLVLEEVIATFSIQKNVNYTINQEQSNVRFSLDRLAIKRALNNLLSNACKHATATVHIHTYVDASRSNFIIEISDDGPGIPEEEKESIFFPFTQSKTSDPSGNSGHGLGLAIVRQIAKWHDGRVYVENASLGGAKFILELAIPS